MRKFITTIALLSLGFANINASGCVTYDPDTEVYTIDKSIKKEAKAGIGYLDSFKAALYSTITVSRDLTDEEMENIQGGGYSDGKWSGENPPQETNDSGAPCYPYSAVEVWEDSDGTVIILEDDGNLIFLSKVKV